MSGTTALEIVKAAKDKGALVFANIENLEAKVDLYRTEVTEITFDKKDFHTINGKKMPNKAATDRIGEACGIQFNQNACRVTAEPHEDSLCGKREVYRAESQGKVRMPDGSWRTSTIDEYEFDYVLRAMLDKNVTELNSKTMPIVGRTIMEYKKVARQRAATGARLRVIRQLTGMPSIFEPAEALKPMIFTRIVQNTDYILQTPEGRAMATAQALGADVASLFGKQQLTAPASQPDTINIAPPSDDDVLPGDKPQAGSRSAMAAEAAENEEPEFPAGPAAMGTGAEFKRLTRTLGKFMDGFKDSLDVMSKNGVNPYKMAEEEMNNPNATVETRRSMIVRIRDWLKAKGVKVRK